MTDGPPARARFQVRIFATRRLPSDSVSLQTLPVVVQESCTATCGTCRSSILVTEQGAMCELCHQWYCDQHAPAPAGGGEFCCRACIRRSTWHGDVRGGADRSEAKLLAAAHKRATAVVRAQRQFQDVLDTHHAAMHLFPAETEALSSKRHWECTMRNARVILDFLTQHKHYHLFLFLHAELQRLAKPADSMPRSRALLADLPHPCTADVPVQRWREEALVLAGIMREEKEELERQAEASDQSQRLQDCRGGAVRLPDAPGGTGGVKERDYKIKTRRVREN